MVKKIIQGIVCALVLVASAIVPMTKANAQANGFALQVSPSPIVETIQPGSTKTIDIKIRNQNTQTETLKMGLQAFTVSNETGEVQLKNEAPADVIGWVNFAEEEFTVLAGEWYTQKMTIAVPQDAAFTYSFAVTISRATPQPQVEGKTTIEGSVAIFALLSIDKPDAVRKLELVEFSSKNRVYEYLPSIFTFKIKNSGNTIVQPAGNIYIQRNAADAEPITVLPVNAGAAYLLPNVTRSLQVEWNNGFPVYKAQSETDKSKKLFWDWSELQNFRFGRYTAKAVVIYNDGTRDIPIEAVVSFWVIPWKLLVGVLVVFAVLVIGVVTLVKKTIKVTKSKKKHEAPAKD